MIRLSFISVSYLRSLALYSSSRGPCDAQTPSPALLVWEKETHAIVDPATLKIVGRVPAGRILMKLRPP